MTNGSISGASALLGTRNVAARYAVPILAVILFVVYSLLEPGVFFSWGNVRAMLNSQAIVLLLALATSISVRSGDLDFSPAAVMVGAGAIFAASSQAGVPLVLALVLAVLFGIVIGLIHALFIVRLGVDSFVMTLGMLIALGGFALLITGSQVLVDIPRPIVDFAITPLLGIPLATWYGWGLLLLVWYVYDFTPAGRYLLFVGGNRDAARLAGVRVSLVRSLALVATSLIAAFTGIVMVGQFASLDPTIAASYILPPAAAVFLGATTIQIGRVNAWGTVCALYLMVIGVTGLSLLGSTKWLNDVFNGVALIIAITVARIAKRRAA